MPVSGDIMAAKHVDLSCAMNIHNLHAINSAVHNALESSPVHFAFVSPRTSPSTMVLSCRWGHLYWMSSSM